MSQFLPSHLKEADTVSSERAQEIASSLGESMIKHINPMMVLGFREFGIELVEWRGEGKYICTPDGKTLFDCVGAGGVFGLGFAQPDIVEAVCQQARRGGLCSRAGYVPGQVELAEKLLKLAPSNLHTVAFGNSGTEAVEMAIKLARLATGKKKLIGTVNGYHGMSIGTISLSGMNMFRDGCGPYLESTVLVNHGNLDSLAEELDDDTAAVVLEPIQWASGCKVVDQDYFKSVKKMCEAKGAMLILDEVQTGLGRTGTPFALEHWGVEPDIMAVGKILSGGMVPMSAVLFGDNVHKVERHRALFNNLSYGGNPLACAAAITALNLLEDRYFARAKELGDQLGEGFEQLKQEFPTLLAGYHGLGLMRCLEFHQMIDGVFFGNLLRSEENIIVAAMSHIPQFVRISPPFIAEDQDITDLISSCRRVLESLRDGDPQVRFDEFSQHMMSMQRATAALDQPVEV